METFGAIAWLIIGLGIASRMLPKKRRDHPPLWRCPVCPVILVGPQIANTETHLNEHERKVPELHSLVSYGIVRVVRSKFWYLVLRGSVVVSTHWTKRSALRAAGDVTVDNEVLKKAKERKWDGRD